MPQSIFDEDLNEFVLVPTVTQCLTGHSTSDTVSVSFLLPTPPVTPFGMQHSRKKGGKPNTPKTGFAGGLPT